MSSHTISNHPSDMKHDNNDPFSGKEEDFPFDSKKREDFEPPPAYERQSNPEDEKERLKYLRLFDTVVLMDDSGSMIEHWSEAKTACVYIATLAAEHDHDGIDLHFLNHKRSYHNLKTESDVSAVFASVMPGRATPLGQALWDILSGYVEEYRGKKEEYEEERRRGRGQRDKKGKTSILSILTRKKTESSKVTTKERRPAAFMKPMNLVVFTDGAATDDVIYPIKDIIKQMDNLGMPFNQIGIQFVQIGSSEDATAFLKSLDDNMGDGVRDIVDTVKWSGHRVDNPGYIRKILLGGMLRNVDADETHS